MLPSYFDYIFVQLRQTVPLRPELSPKFLSTLGPNLTRKPRPDLQLSATSRQNIISIIVLHMDLNSQNKACEKTSCLAQVVEQWTGNPKAEGGKITFGG